MDAKLKVVKGPGAGLTLQIARGKLLIGRADDCDFRPVSEVVSGYHCVLLLDDYTLRVRDLASKNGTRVNGRRIASGSASILLHDDIVSIGEMELIVDLTQSDARTDPPHSATPAASPSALEKTGIIDGDTLQDKIPGPIAPSPPNPISAVDVNGQPPAAGEES
ncbi:MAG TPA: FHA domain-containing protein [Planctomycetaceae bacterium]|nr:FHA domain-containing protein [Planctomycetaceae bacterium]